MAGDAGREQRLPLGNDADPGQQVGRWGVLEQEAAGACPQRGEDVLVEVEGREDEDPRCRGARVAEDPSRGLEPVHDAASGCPSARRPATREVASATASSPFWANPTTARSPADSDESLEAGTHEGLVIDDEDADHRAVSSGAGALPAGRRLRPTAKSRAPGNRRARPDRPQAPAEDGDALAHAEHPVPGTGHRLDGSFAPAGVGHLDDHCVCRGRSRGAVATPAPCLRTLVRASCATRYADKPDARRHRIDGRPRRRSSTCTPASSSCRTRTSRSPSPADGSQRCRGLARPTQDAEHPPQLDERRAGRCLDRREGFLRELGAAVDDVMRNARLDRPPRSSSGRRRRGAHERCASVPPARRHALAARAPPRDAGLCSSRADQRARRARQVLTRRARRR